ncbi:MAG: bis(5'-nucleosyl)-tetraphosphatase (symmetrical) YqeK [Spirochaetes bacterium]|nr:bis(5'-nucleosyl)-tetraphosphatase (symmetrical) YqeK [Spirochaetota bacterium]
MSEVELESSIESYLRLTLSPKRFIHSLNTAEWSRNLASRFDMDPQKGYWIGLLHDAARELPPEELLQRTKSLGIQPDPIELENPILLHGLISAEIARSRFGIREEELLEAIRHHTLGKPSLHPYGKVLYVADYIEPSRTFVDDTFRATILSLSLDEMLLKILEEEKRFRKNLAPITQEMYDELRGRILERA